MKSIDFLKIFCLLCSGEAVIFPSSLRKPAGSVLAVSSQQHSAGNVDVEFDNFLEDWFNDFMARKPMEALRFGRQLPTCQGLAAKRSIHVHQIWGDPSSSAETEGIQKDKYWLQDMSKHFSQSIGSRDLSDERHVSYKLLQSKVEEMRKENLYRAFRPPFGPLGCQLGVMGCQVQVLGMIRGLSISNLDDASCYVALLNGLPDFLLGHGLRLQEAASRGATPYHLVLEAVAKDCDANLQSEGQSARSHALFEAFADKLQTVKGITGKHRKVLLQDAEEAIINGVWPAYLGLRKIAQQLLPKSVESTKGLAFSYGTEARNFYAYRVGLLGVGGDASSLHEKALKLVDDNAKEIRRQASLAFPNSMAARASSPAVVMQALRKPYSDASYENSENGRALYLKDVQGHIDVMWQSLHESSQGEAKQRLFFPSDIPVLSCSVQRIQSPTFPGLAQYSPGSIGKVNRSATVGFNVYDMSKISKMDMEVLAYHEVVPGHHLQVTKALTLPLPSFRRFFGDEAFSEGWAVYAEQDISPRLVNLSVQSRLGRLNLLQTRAVRMAVDTGIHALNWDRKKAEAFYTEHTMITPERAVQAVDRHFAWPSQALNYAAGYEEMKRLRNAVSVKPGLVKAIGKDWEAMLHKAILSHGDLPLSMLDQVVFSQLNAWSDQDLLQSLAHQSLLSVVVLLCSLGRIMTGEV